MTQRISIAVVLLAAFLMSSPHSTEAQATTCEPSVNCTCDPSDSCCYNVWSLTTSGDAEWSPSKWDWCVNPDFIPFWRNAFGMIEEHWAGDGWDIPTPSQPNACYIGSNDPFTVPPGFESLVPPTHGRTMTAILAFCYSHDLSPPPLDSPTTGIFLYDACGWAASRVTSLQAKCDSKGGRAAHYEHSSALFGGTPRIELFPPFYSSDVFTRGATLAHEARHWGGDHPHVAEVLGYGRSVDLAWDDHGANFYEAMWLASYATWATEGTSKALRCRAKKAAVDMMTNAGNHDFVEGPGLNTINYWKNNNIPGSCPD